MNARNIRRLHVIWCQRGTSLFAPFFYAWKYLVANFGLLGKKGWAADLQDRPPRRQRLQLLPFLFSSKMLCAIKRNLALVLSICFVSFYQTPEVQKKFGLPPSLRSYFLPVQNSRFWNIIWYTRQKKKNERRIKKKMKDELKKKKNLLLGILIYTSTKWLIVVVSNGNHGVWSRMSREPQSIQ
jgi:hypothetical protein